MKPWRSDTAGTTSQTAGIALLREFSPYPPERGSDVYLCGTCGIILARRPAGMALTASLLSCSNGATIMRVGSDPPGDGWSSDRGWR